MVLRWLNACRPTSDHSEAMHTEFHMTPFLALVLIGYALFMGTLLFGWIKTQLD